MSEVRRGTRGRLLRVGAACLLLSPGIGCGITSRLLPESDGRPFRERVQFWKNGREFNDPEAARTAETELAAAEDLYRREQFAAAHDRYERIANNRAVSPMIAEKARYYQAECLRQSNKLTEAAATYNRLLNDYPAGIYREQSVVRMFHIANGWLEGTKAEIEQMIAAGEVPKPSLLPAHFISFDKNKPTFDVEGHALQTLENVHFSDPTGPYSDKALFMIGFVHFYRGNFRDADIYLTQLINLHKDSPLRDSALELAIMAKNNSTGGALYDARKCSEALRLIQNAGAISPETARKRGEFLASQTRAIQYQLAEKDFKVAEFYERTDHPGSAFFYYTLVVRRYPDTPWAAKAQQRADRLEADRAAGKFPQRMLNESNDAFSGIRRRWQNLFGTRDDSAP